jgi:hypothetical protein
MELDNVWLGNEIIVHTPKFEEQQFDKKKKEMSSTILTGLLTV